MACGQHDERIIHLAQCQVIRDEFWWHVVCLMKDLGYPICAQQDLDAFLLLGYIDDDEDMIEEQAGILFLAWRCLYAEIIGARIDDRSAKWKRAARRAVALLISRLTAEGEPVGKMVQQH